MQIITQPFMKIIKNWIFNGELNDVLGEFCISENLSGTDVWLNKYRLEASQIPSIIEKI